MAMKIRMFFNGHLLTEAGDLVTRWRFSWTIIIETMTRFHSFIYSVIVSKKKVFRNLKKLTEALLILLGPIVPISHRNSFLLMLDPCDVMSRKVVHVCSFFATKIIRIILVELET